jgi:hypothetical protein
MFAAAPFSLLQTHKKAYKTCLMSVSLSTTPETLLSEKLISNQPYLRLLSALREENTKVLTSGFQCLSSGSFLFSCAYIDQALLSKMIEILRDICRSF